MFPDVLEPAINSSHRNAAHSWVAGGAVVAGLSTLDRWEAYCRQRAASQRALRTLAEVDPFTSFLHLLAELFWQIAAGFASGLLAGYTSHLALDALMPRGLPLL
jgi:hypothetical protein